MNQELYKSMVIFNGKLTDLVQHLNTEAIPNLSYPPPQKKNEKNNPAFILDLLNQYIYFYG
ncbi:hypothetical protein ET834_10430 [Salmonella enterica subsp. enterica serovar Amsterdam]|nr:hypothetical protein [Salmonella enterica subsp. enterica serovar Amsterdam]ECA4903909.1 hypothetical protein [Salmonella enterica subsp. enterica serovar Amsterdam]ECA8486656.1 hypothetical protein [Salmonella enterica subsp. enterica serovar Amsterdam]ECD0331278.1 hypothetical protein [Salmonella enterica subsp. enterica serovar Amsterdam]